MLYTIGPHELIFAEQETPEFEFVSFTGGALEALRMEDGRYQVRRVISTDPNDFLRFSPGDVIDKDSLKTTGR